MRDYCEIAYTTTHCARDGHPSRFVVRCPRSIYTRRHQTDMAKDTQMPELTRDDVAALIDILRKAGRPMTTDELVAALREAAAQG